MQKNIYHIHDKCCLHSSNTLESTVKYALEAGYKKLYFTEHSPIPNNKYYHRATYKDLQDYKMRIDALNKKYKNKLQLFLGYEIEFSEAHRLFYEKLTRDPICDYAIFGNHFYGDMWKPGCTMVKSDTRTKHNLKEYWTNYKLALDSGLFTWIAHPEIWSDSYKKWDKTSIGLMNKIFQTALDYDIPLGYNINFIPKERTEFSYPCDTFWRHGATNYKKIQVIVESDSHAPHTLTKEWVEQGRQMALKAGLGPNLLKDVKLKLFPKKPVVYFIDKSLSTDKLALEAKQQKAAYIEIDTNSKKNDLLKILKNKHVCPAWAVAISSNKKLIASLKTTSIFIATNIKCKKDFNIDLTKISLKEIKDNFLQMTEFQ